MSDRNGLSLQLETRGTSPPPLPPPRTSWHPGHSQLQHSKVGDMPGPCQRTTGSQQKVTMPLLLAVPILCPSMPSRTPGHPLPLLAWPTGRPELHLELQSTPRRPQGFRWGPGAVLSEAFGSLSFQMTSKCLGSESLGEGGPVF